MEIRESMSDLAILQIQEFKYIIRPPSDSQILPIRGELGDGDISDFEKPVKYTIANIP